MLCSVSKLCFPFSFLVVKNKVAIFGEEEGGGEKREGEKGRGRGAEE